MEDPIASKQHYSLISNNFQCSDMFCWGNTVHGELGLGGIEEEQILTPRELQFSSSNGVKQVACGENHTIVVTCDGHLYSCGSNDHGQLGHNKACKKLEMVENVEAYVFTQASCGVQHSLAVNEWGQVFSWGSDSHGQLGFGSDSVNQSVPKMIKSLAPKYVVQITTGYNHCLALTNDGELYSWGCNEYGQLGLGTKIPKERKPCLIRSLSGIPIAIIACGANHSFAVSKSGAVYGWGKNVFGQLGLNDDSNKIFPSQLRTLRSVSVKYIACGEDFSVFLTKDGGVFTCGAGMYGQLGHGSTGNEILPRKVMELMGSTVTQITCGRRHTLALVPSRGRVYAFGLGGAGQLGTRGILNSSTPQVVLGPWVSPSGVSLIQANPQSEYSRNCVVKKISAGGDRCFAIVTRKEDNIPPDDFREHDPLSQILTLTFEKIRECQSVAANEIVDQDLMTYMETVFSSQACFNSSFLLPQDEHYCCTSKHHGIDVSFAEQCFQILSTVENESIQRLILTCINEFLLPSLSSSPPDVETLRIYLLLPYYHKFDDPSNCFSLHWPFGTALLQLKQEAGKVVGLWWRNSSLNYFERLIKIYKGVVMHILETNDVSSLKKPENEKCVYVALEILSRLNQLNNSVSDLKVPYETFYLTNLIDKIDVRSDYLHWLMVKDYSKTGKMYFCSYPFVFDAPAKTLLLQTDQTLQMQSAMNQAATQAFTAFIFSPNVPASISTFLELQVSRETLVQDTIRELSKYHPSDLKKPLKVKFFGEEAEDAGGVTKEFFLLLMKEILDPKYGMFYHYEETRTIWFNEYSLEEDMLMYYLIGIICGLAIYNFTIIDLPFPLVLYKKLLGEPVTMQDLKGLSPTLERSLRDILEYEGSDLESVFCLTFEITREVFGEIKTVPLKPDGGKIPVTQENKQEFIDLYVDLLLKSGVEKHFNPFSKGFHNVCGGRILKLFRSHELMAVVVGNENYDWEELEKSAEYKNGYTANDPTIKFFWEVFHELTLEQKKMFLLYLTGSDRIPILGMKAIKIIIQPTNDDKYLPVAHTCFNLLDLPRYGTKERLRYKLLQAIQQTQGFSIV